MKRNIHYIVLAALATLTVSATAFAADPTGAEVMKMADEAPDGENGRSEASMVLTDKNGDTRDRQFTVQRMDFEDGVSKYFLEFSKPADVAGMKFMVWDYTDKPDDRWMYLPRMRMVRRIAADDERGAFVGSDFTYEDISGRDPAKDTHSLLRTEELDGRKMWVVESVPKDIDAAGFSKKTAWVDQQNHLIMKEDYVDGNGNSVLAYEVLKVETIQDIPTAVERKMSNPKSGHSTVMSFSNITYNVDDMDEDQFTVRALKR